MFPEISARWSLLEPSFRYLSPGIEGEKCRPLDHMWQIPFIHLVQFLITSHFYIYMKVFPVISSMWYVKERLCTTIAHVLFKHTLPKVKNDYSRHFDLHTVRARSNCHKIHWFFVCPFAEQTKFFIISCLHIKFLSSCRVASKDPKEKASWSNWKDVLDSSAACSWHLKVRPQNWRFCFTIVFATRPFLPIFKIL